MNRLFRYLNQPYPVMSRRINYVVISSLVILFVLGIFQPFGISGIANGKGLMLLGYVLVSAVGSSLVAYIFPLLFKRFYTTNWTLGKNLLNFLFIILVISVGNTLFTLLYIEKERNLTASHVMDVSLAFLIITFLVGIVPVAIILFVQSNAALKQHLSEAQELNRKLSAKPAPAQPAYTSAPLTLAGSTKESIELHPEQLISLEACGNYVKVNYIDGDKLRQKALRATIKQIEDQLTPYPFLLRCHRAFIINTEQIASVKGNTQGYRLVVNHLTAEIPVSRGYAKSLRDRL